MVSALALALALAAQTETHRVQRPLADVPFSPVGFACLRSDGLPTLNLDETDGANGYRFQLWYNQVGDPRVIFVLGQPSGTVTYEYEGDTEEGRYLVHAEGSTVNGNGIANGVPARIDLVVRRRGRQLLTGDFSIEAGTFSRREVNCDSVERPRRLPRTGS